MEKPLSLDKVIFVLKRGLEFRQVRDENLKLRTILGHEDELAGNDEKRKLLRESTATLEFENTDPRYLHKQKSVAVSNIIYGIGLHSGEKTGMVIKPLPAGKGIRFENISKEGYIRPASNISTTAATPLR